MYGTTGKTRTWNGVRAFTFLPKIEIDLLLYIAACKAGIMKIALRPPKRSTLCSKSQQTLFPKCGCDPAASRHQEPHT